MNFKYIDTHAHVNFPDYDNDREEVIQRALNESVCMINVGTDLESSRGAVELAKKYNDANSQERSEVHGESGGVYAIVGIHPHEAMKPEIINNFYDVLAQLKVLAQEDIVVAIGECGLDFFKIKEYNESFSEEEVKSVQERLFRAQIEIAIALNKPLMIHARDSYGEILEILHEYLMLPTVKLKGNVHFFAGTIDQAKAFISCGFTVSFTGVITFAKNYEDLVRELPLESMLSETDCPFVAPVPFRGKRAEPWHAKLVVEKIAEIKGLDIDYTASVLVNNAKRVFQI